ncbi:MAG: hypothetical protein AAF927_20200 [Bacteroidota bacterium]
MAGKKQTNRQKMINMMYLILTAMLALNVSSEALDAFLTFHDRLSVSATDANRANLSSIDYIRREIKNEISKEGKEDNKGLLDTLDQIRAHTDRLVNIINAHSLKMMEIADFDPEANTFKRIDELEENYQYWMGEDDEASERRGNGAAYGLRDSLNAYFRYIGKLHNAFVADSQKIEIKQMQDPAPTEQDEGKRWEQYTFQGPVVGNLGVLESLKLEMYQEEKKLLDQLQTRLGDYIFVPDKVMAITAPSARIVPAGMQFETQLFVGMSSTQMKPIFQSGSGRIELEDGGNQATLKVKADGSRIPAGQNQYLQTYTATVKVPKRDGTFEVMNIRDQFIVRKPEVVFTSKVVQNLYRRCGNTININVPALGDNYDPVISATEAQVRNSGSNRTLFLIDPSGRKSTITVKSRTNGGLIEIDRVAYNVMAPPKPVLQVKINRREYNGVADIPASSRITVKLLADREFKNLLAKDARYGAERIVIKLKDGLQPARVINTMPVNGLLSESDMRVILGTEGTRAKAGSKIFITIEGVYRLNYRGEKIPDKRLSELDRTVSFTVRR